MTDFGKWVAVDDYFAGLFVRPDEALTATLASSAAAGLPEIAVAPNQGKLLHLLVRMNHASRILEIGTLGGYSTIWMARALPTGGKLVTLELDTHHAAVARRNFQTAQVAHVVELREGAALDSLKALVAENVAPFDLIFIDADKANIPHYFTFAMALAREGTVVIVDNVVRNGEVANASSTDAAVIGVRTFNEMVATEPRVSATALQTVGAKGYDGLAILLVTSTTVSVP